MAWCPSPSSALRMAATTAIAVPGPSPVAPHKTGLPPSNGKWAMSSVVSAPRSTVPVAAPRVRSDQAARATEAATGCSLASTWREIQGCDDWRDLVRPLNPLLSREIVRYGEFIVACYEAFDLDPRSKRYLNCKHGKRRVLSEVGLGSSGYEVTKYIYASGSGECSRWIGFVAVASDDAVRRLGRRDVLVSLRGTVTSAEWLANFKSALTPARLDPHEPRPDVRVESGFLSLYTSDDSTCRFSPGSCREQLLGELSRILGEHKGEEMSITLAGHSMGSSIALLLGYDLAELGLNRRGSDHDGGQEIPITVYSFGGPRVGNSGFKKRCEELGVKVLRVVNVNDFIPRLPGVFLNEDSKHELPWSCSCYAHVGVELALDFFKVRNPVCVHNMETYLGLLKHPVKKAQAGRKDRGECLLSKAKEVLSTQRFDAWAWQDAAIQVGDLVQSLGF